MSPLLACPDLQTLERLTLGQLPDPEAVALGDHVLSCPDCAARLQALRVEDSLVEAVRRAPAASARLPRGERVEELAERLCRLRPADTPAEVGATLSSVPDITPAPEADVACDFLAPPQSADEIGRLGEYRVLRVLGAGGMGVVFLAEDTRLSRRVALKTLRPGLGADAAARERFLREAKAAAAIKHDHVVAIHHVGEYHGVPFLVMEYLEGETLETRLKRERVLPVAEVLRIGRESALGLVAAHGQGLIHRDIKPANLWLESPDGRVKVLDFGLARPERDSAQLTHAGTVVGTPAYMAPEQASGERAVQRSDLFSLGVVLYCACTGQMPFRGDNMMAVLSALATETPRTVRDVNPDVPPALAALVMHLLARDPRDRPPSARAVAEWLRSIELQPDEPASPAQPGSSVRPTRSRWGLLAVAVLLLALLPLGYFYGGTIVRFATNKGQIVIEGEDGMDVTVKEKGAVIRDPKGQREITVLAGEHELDVTVKDAAGEIRFFTKRLTLSRGGKQILDVQMELAAIPPSLPAGLPRPVAHWTFDDPKGDLGKDSAEHPANGTVGGEVAQVEGVIGRAAGFNGGNHIQVADQPKLKLRSRMTLAAWVKPTDVPGGWIVGKWYGHDSYLLAREEGSYWVRAAFTTGAEWGTAMTVPAPATAGRWEHMVGVYDGESVALYVDGRLARSVKVAEDENIRAAMARYGLRTVPRGLQQSEQDIRIGHQFRGLIDEVQIYDVPLTSQEVAKLAQVGNPDRRAAEWALNLGGHSVTIEMQDGRSTLVTKSDALPRVRFHLLDINLWGNNKTTDEGLANLAGLERLTNFGNNAGGFSNAGLAHFGRLKTLRGLDLASVKRIDDAGLIHLKGLPHLADLSLAGTGITNAGVDQLALFPTLADLDLAFTAISGADRLAGMTRLRRLSLEDTKLTAAGVRRLAGLKELVNLNVAGLPVDDDTLAALAGLSNLSSLSLGRTQITDAGLKHLYGLTQLRNLNVEGTKVSAEGVAALQKALPQCQIDSDHPKK